jgi:hypothetical protein
MDDRMINEYGAGGRMRTVKGNRCLREDLPQAILSTAKIAAVVLGYSVVVCVTNGSEESLASSCLCLKMRAAGSFKTLVTTYQITCHNPENHHLFNVYIHYSSHRFNSFNLCPFSLHMILVLTMGLS